MVSEKFMILDFVYRKLQKFKELVREENVLFKISVEIGEVIDLLKVCMIVVCIFYFKFYGLIFVNLFILCQIYYKGFY